MISGDHRVCWVASSSRMIWRRLISAFFFYSAFGFNVGTMFPIGFVALGGILGIAASKPDEPKAHF